MQRTAIAIAHQQRVDQALLRRGRGRLMPLRGNRLLLLHGLRCSLVRLRRHWLRVYRLVLRRLITLLRSGGRLLIVRGRLLRLDFRRRRKQRLARPLIDQRFHRREFIIRRRERISARRLLSGVALLLGGGKLARQLRFRRSVGVIVISRVIVFPAMAIALLLGGGELASQFILLHSIRFLIREQLIVIMGVALRLPRTLFRLPLRR